MKEKMKPSQIFSKRLKEARKIRELGQNELAEKSGLPASSISHFESETGTRKPSFENLQRLALALEASTDFLLGKSNEIDAVAEADPLYRDFKNLSSKDRELAKEFVYMLSQREKKQKSG